MYDQAPGILRSGSRAVSTVIDTAMSEAEAHQDTQNEARWRLEKAHREVQGPKPAAPMFAVPIKQLGAALKSYGLSTSVNGGLIGSSDKAKPMAMPSEAIIGEMRRGGVRAQVAMRDRVQIGKDGTVTGA